MKRSLRRLLAWAAALALALTLVPPQGQAAQDVYFTAANETILELSGETMPFYSSGTLYVSNKLFDGTDLGVTYIRNATMGLAVLYTPRTDLRFDLENNTVYNKDGTSYNGRAIEKGGYVFFPLDLVCRYFGLSWSLTETDLAPLIRVTSSSAVLDDSSFIDAASDQMGRYYAAYEKQVESQPVEPPEDPPIIHASKGQKVLLIIESQSSEDTRALLSILEDVQATFLLTAEQMEDGDLLRGLVAEGHAVALRAVGEMEAEVESEIERARELLWDAACSWLQLVWYEGPAETGALLEEMGCVRVTARLDRRDTGLTSAARARTLLSVIGRYRSDLTVFLGGDSGCLKGLDTLLEGLQDAQYRICAYRVTS